MSANPPVKIGVAGIGGYARAVTRVILEHGPTSDPPVQLVAACDPDPTAHHDAVAALRDAGAQVLHDYDALLAVPGLEAVWLPVPIDLHRPFTERALEADLAVMCEKPPAGCIDDLDAMVAARERAGRPVAIGFQDVYDRTTMPTKRRLLDGAIGAVREAVVWGCWPRSSAYFSRAGWAGRLQRHGTWVLDSPVQNAMSHYVNLALFLLGSSEWAAAEPVAIEAELYRAAAIENYDTASLRVHLAGGGKVLVLLTHACAEARQPVVRLEGERGRVVWTPAEVRIEAGDDVQTLARDSDARGRMLQRFARAVRGIADPETALATLETSRPHALVVGGASEAAPVRAVPTGMIDVVPAPDGGTFATVSDLVSTFEAAAATGQMLHETGRLPFTAPAGRRDLRGYRHFAGPASTETADAATAPTSAPPTAPTRPGG